MDKHVHADDLKVSIVIPTYNHADYLRLALKSVVEQTETRWEAIVVNNYSTDDTHAVVESFKDRRIQIVDFRNHGVIGASRNEGIRLARAEWVAFLDSDDRWLPRKLELCLAQLGDEFDLVCHDENVIRGKKVLYVNHYGPQERATFRSMLFERGCLSTSATVVRKQNLKQLNGFCEDADVVTAEDYDLWIRLAHSGTRMKFLREVLGEYRLHELNSSASVLRHMTAVQTVVKRNYAQIERPTVLDSLRLKRRLAYSTYFAGRGFQEKGLHKEAFRFYAKSAVDFPFFDRPYVGAVLNAWSLLSNGKEMGRGDPAA